MAKELCRLCGSFLGVGKMRPVSLSRLTMKQAPVLITQSRNHTHRQADPFKRSFPKEQKPDYDLEGSGFINEGEVIFPEPEPTLTEVEEVESEAVWKYVERLLPRTVIPEVPDHKSYPTPSGWSPPQEKSLQLPYTVRRTRYHHLPLNLEILDGGNRKMTRIRKVDGDIWALERDVRAHLEGLTDRQIFTSVDEVCGKVRVRGNYMEEVSQFLLEQGF